MRYTVLCLFSVVLLVSCKQNEETQGESTKSDAPAKTVRALPPSTGAKAEVIIVCDDTLWEGRYGTQMRRILSSDQYGTRNESYFDLFHVRERNFKEMLKRTRHLVHVYKSSRNHAAVIHDEYARPQKYVRVEYTDEKALDTLLPQVLRTAFFEFRDLDMEIIRKKWRQKSWPVPKPMADEGIDFIFPTGFQTTVEEKDLVVGWASSKNADLVVFVFVRPFSIEDQLTFTNDSIIAWRDSISKIHIPADAEGSYTQTEMLPKPEHRLTKIGDLVAVETRGYFRSVGDYMGGSFVNFTVFDDENERVIMLDGLVYAPNEKKRNVLMELESMFRSLEVSKRR